MAQKKGPWTPAEDAILRDFVKEHGEGNWNEVEKNTSLARCGKSCRLRWANHLCPEVKKGPFSPEDQQKIAQLHAIWGNKWARMALQFPGRSDNDIKNYWNTRKKRHQRSNIPLYPENILQKIKNTTQPGPDIVDSSVDESLNGHDPSCSDSFVLPKLDIDIEQVRLRARQGLYFFPPDNLSRPQYIPPMVSPREPGPSYSGMDGYKNICDHDPQRDTRPMYEAGPVDPWLMSFNRNSFSLIEPMSNVQFRPTEIGAAQISPDECAQDLFENVDGDQCDLHFSVLVPVSMTPELELSSFQTLGIQQNGSVQESALLNCLPVFELDDALLEFSAADRAQSDRHLFDPNNLNNTVMAESPAVIPEAAGTLMPNCQSSHNDCSSDIVMVEPMDVIEEATDTTMAEATALNGYSLAPKLGTHGSLPSLVSPVSSGCAEPTPMTTPEDDSAFMTLLNNVKPEDFVREALDSSDDDD